MPDIFLSYSREDQPTARRFAEALEREGFKVWWDQALNPGETFDQVTAKALRDARAVVVLWSKRSVESRWVRSEATQADRYGTLMPVMIEPCERPIMFELTHTVDLSHWNGSSGDVPWRSFIDSLHRLVDRREATATQAAAPMAAHSPPPPAAAPASGGRRQGLTLAIAVVAALLAGGGLVWALLHGRGTSSPPGPAAAAVQSRQSGPVTLAVLPFSDLSAAHDQEYFSDGLTEEILNQLAQVRELTVTGRTSSFSFKNKNEDLRVIADKLGVANLLEGSVRRDGKQLRITAQLIDGRSGTHRWSQTYPRELSDVFTVQEEIAKDVAKALSITLDVGSMSRAKGGTTNVEAYDRYLRAHSLMLQGGREASEQAAPLLREAVTLDPNFALAWLTLSDALGLSASSLSATEVAPIAREMAQATDRGVALAPESRAALAVRMSRFVDQRKWAEAVAAFREFMRAGTLDAENLLGVGGGLGVLLATGHRSEALQLARQVQQVEPLSVAVSTDLQIALYANGQYQASETEVQRSLGLVGNHQRAYFRKLLLLLVSEKPDPAAVQAQFRLVLADQNVTAPFLRTLAATINDRAASRAVLRKAFEDPANHDFARSMVIFQLADALDDGELALEVLRGMIQSNRVYPVMWLATHSGMRSNSGFKQMLRELGLVDYWRASGDWGDSCRPVGKDDFECS